MKVSRLVALKKKLGKVKRGTFRANQAFWYVKLIKGAEVQPESTPDNEAIEITVNDYHNLSKWLKKHSSDYPWIYNQQEIEYAAQYGHLYASIYHQGEIVGYVKVALVWAYIEDYEDGIPLEADEAFIYDTFTLPKFQKRHFATKLLSAVLDHLKTSAVNFVFCHIPEWNIASRKLYQKLGFKKIAPVRYVRIMKRQYFSNKPLAVKAKGRAACLGM